MSDSMTLSSAPSYFFEISDLSNGAVFTDSAIRSFMITCNRKYSATGGDKVTTKFVTAVAAGVGGSVFPPRTQVPLPGLRDGSSIADQPLEYFDMPYSITVVGLDVNNNKISGSESHNLLKYVVQPKNDYLQEAVIGSSAGVITVDMPGLASGSQFSTNGLKYMIQIDGPNSDGDYKSRNYIVDASNVDGSANFTTDGQTEEDILNNEYFDVAVIAINATGSEILSENISSVLVSANANPPASVTLSDELNAENSTARFTITVQGNPVEGDDDKKYVLFVARSDASGTNLLSSSNVEIDASSAPVSVTTTQLGLDSVLVPNVEYIVKVAAKNSTNNASAYLEADPVRPESKPSDLSITDTLVRLQADPTDPSGKIKVVLAPGYKENGQNVSLYAIAADVSGQTSTQTALNTAITNAITARIEIPDASLNNNTFILTGLNDGHDYVIGVTLENDSSSNLTLTTFANATYNATSGNYTVGTLIQPGTALQKPEIKEIAPLDGSFSELGSGNAQVRLGFPEVNATDLSNGYLTLNENYTDYKLWAEDQSGNAIYMDPSWTAFSLDDYKAKGFKWVDSSDSESTVVTNSSTNAPTSPAATGTWVYDNQGQVHDMLYNEKPYIRNDASGNPVTILAPLSGLDNSKKYTVKAQMRVDGEETTVVDTEQYLRTSAHPVLDSDNAGYIGGIFDLVGNFLEYGTAGGSYDPSENYVKFSKDGINQVLENASNNGYEIDAVNVVFYATDSNIISETAEKRKIHKVFKVNKPLANSPNSIIGEILFTGAGNYDLNTDSEYTVVVIPQNSVYKQSSYADVPSLLATPGLIKTTTPVKLSSEILEVSGNVVLSSSVVNGALTMNVAFEVADDSDNNSTKFQSVDVVLAREKPVWDSSNSTWSWVADGDYVSPPNLMNLSNNNTSVYSLDIVIDASYYGWKYTATATVNSSPDTVSNGVVYSASASSQTHQPSRKPTIILDASSVEIVPNGSQTEAITIDLSGDSVIENSVSMSPAALLSYNSFMYNGVLNSLAGHGFTLQKFLINVNQVLQIHAFNESGRTTLTNETRFTVEVLSNNATLLPSNNDGTFVLFTGGNQVEFRLQLQP
jgi:hypothetical protein